MANVISADPTPNENAMKFTMSGRISESGKTFSSAEAAQSNNIAKAVFALGGVKSVFMVADFVTVTKFPEASWDELAQRVWAAIDAAA
ncbi:MAG: NifU N-terminal domain-containing protein [Candidatus Sumerlaeia bacterium]|nr:NifU N-terminal domain-containing protein [Candidatus Sumerlaeia bacterium]